MRFTSIVMSVHNGDNLRRILEFLRQRSREQAFNISSIDQIAGGTEISTDQVGEEINEAIVNNLVDADHYTDDGVPLVKINSAGLVRLRVLQENENQRGLGEPIPALRSGISDYFKRHKAILAVVIISFIVGAFFFFLTYVVPPLYVHDNSMTQDGVYGDSYKSYSLNFQISRLTPDWSFQDIKSISDEYNITYGGATLLGGVMVSSPYNTKVNVLVFDAKEPIFSDLGNFAQGSMNALSTGLHVKSKDAVNYLDNNSVLFQIVGVDYTGWSIIFKEKVERHIDKVYVIQSVAKSYKDPFQNETIQDLQNTYNSFGYLK